MNLNLSLPQKRPITTWLAREQLYVELMYLSSSKNFKPYAILHLIEDCKTFRSTSGCLRRESSMRSSPLVQNTLYSTHKKQNTSDKYVASLWRLLYSEASRKRPGLTKGIIDGVRTNSPHGNRSYTEESEEEVDCE